MEISTNLQLRKSVAISGTYIIGKTLSIRVNDAVM